MAHKMTYRTDLQQQEILFTEKKGKKYSPRKEKNIFMISQQTGFPFCSYVTLCSKILVLVMSRSTKVQVKLNIVE